MSRTITVVAAHSGATADVRLDSRRTLADVLPQLRQLTGSTSRALTRDGVALDPGLPVAHLLDGEVLTLGDPLLDDAPGGTAPGTLRLEVLTGPDAGRLIPLPVGRWSVGRGTDDRSLSDPLVSRRHFDVLVDEVGQVSVIDLASANGTWLAGEAVPAERPMPWPAGALLRCGDTYLTHGRHHSPAAVSVGGDGTVTVNRPPRLTTGGPRSSITFPARPRPTTVGRLPWLASLAPLLAGVVLAAVMHRWEFLAFAVMSPLVVLGQALSDRLGARRNDRRAAREHAEATARAEAALTVALAAEVKARHERMPDLATLVRAAVDRTVLLWHRGGDDDDAMTLRLGVGSAPSEVDLDGSRTRPTLHDVPVGLDLFDVQVLGVCGDAAAALTRSLIVQAATLLGPADLRITMLVPSSGRRWSWTRWLPHVRLATTTAQLRRQLDRLSADQEGGRSLVVVDGADNEVVTTLARAGHHAVICLADHADSLPAACTVVITANGTHAVVRRSGEDAHDVVADLVATDVAEQVARALCPLRDGRTAAATLPASLTWSQLHDVGLGTANAADALVRRWRGGPSTAVCLGVAADGPLVVDLQLDGPHLLVAGTTGSGKSELLQTLVASLAAGNSPADLNLLLVDFKGGAAFGPCASLPHTVGVLTDLDQATTTRAVESLTAELRRREQLLAEVGASDIDTWRARALANPSLSASMPRLVIVVDEFATLAEELPDFVGGLVGIAQRGRSLGVHLVLATQRPEGAVSADIRANTRMRICLAVAREAESRDVLDSPRATTISRSTPGRAFLRVGAHELVEVQTARVAGPHAPPRASATGAVEVVPLESWGEDDTAPPRSVDGPTELDLLVGAAVEAAAELNTRQTSPPWLPPLPDRLTLSQLTGTEAGSVPVGLVDQPQHQSQPTLTVGLDDAEPWLVVGAGRSGRTTALTAFAIGLAGALGPDDLHVYGLAQGNGLSTLCGLPHTGAVVDLREIDRVDRLLTFLTSEVDRRLAASDATHPAMLLVVDSWDGLVAATADLDAGRSQDLLLRLLASGPAVGLRVVMTSDRSGLTGRLSAAVRHRLCLRLADPADYALLGVPPRRVPATMPPGRAIRADDTALVQLALPDDAAIRRAERWPAATRAPRRFEPLPSRVPLHTLTPAAGRLIVGVGGDDASAVTLDPDDAGGAFLVAGPPRSGRSTALVSIAAQLHGRSPLALCSRPGPLRQRRDLAVIADSNDAMQSRAALQSLPADGALLVDDIDTVDDIGLLEDIEATMRRLRDGGGIVVLAGTTDAMAASFRGPVAQARRARAGLLLRPEGAHDGELLGLRLRRRPGQSDPPGRGVLALHGRAVPVQVPDPS